MLHVEISVRPATFLPMTGQRVSAECQIRSPRRDEKIAKQIHSKDAPLPLGSLSPCPGGTVATVDDEDAVAGWRPAYPENPKTISSFHFLAQVVQVEVVPPSQQLPKAGLM